MAVAFGAVGPSAAGSGGAGIAAGGTVTWSHTPGAGDTLVIVTASVSSATGTISGVTYGGSSMTNLGNVAINGSGTDGHVYMFSFDTPGSGAHTIIATVGVATSDVECGSISVSGSVLTAGLPAVATGHNPTGTATNDATLTLTGVASTSLVVAGCASGSALGPPVGSSTTRWINNQNNSSAAGNGAGMTNSGTGSVTVDEGISGTDFWGVIAVEVPQSGGGAATPVIQSSAPQLAPGWHPGRNLPGLPGGTPFFSPPNSGVTTQTVQTIIATASAAGAGAVTALVTEIPFATATGAGAVTGNVTQPGSGGAAGAGAVSTLVTQIAPGTSAGAGAVTDVATQAVKASAGGAGSVTAAVTETTGASVAGAGVVTAVVTEITFAAAAAAGAVNANSGANSSGIASIAGAAAVTAFATVVVPATVTGAAAVTAKAAQAVTASPAGAAAVTASVLLAVTATAAAAGSVTAQGLAAAAIVNAVSHPAVTGQVAGNRVTGQVPGAAVSQSVISTPAVSGG